MTAFVTLAEGLDFPEGPSVGADGAIWLSELRGGRIVRVDPDGCLRRYPVGGSPNGTAIAPDGTVWFCDAQLNQVRRLDPMTGSTETLAHAVDGKLLAAPNDLAFDPDGGLVFTCPGDSRRDPIGYVCRRAPDGTVSRIADGLLFPNGVCFSADGAKLFVAETYAQRVVASPWQEHLALSSILATPGPIGPDGVAIGADGTCYTCVYGVGIVRSVSATMNKICDLVLPDAHPAGCAMDPKERWQLLVTGTATGVLLGTSA